MNFEKAQFEVNSDFGYIYNTTKNHHLSLNSSILAILLLSNKKDAIMLERTLSFSINKVTFTKVDSHSNLGQIETISLNNTEIFL